MSFPRVLLRELREVRAQRGRLGSVVRCQQRLLTKRTETEDTDKNSLKSNVQTSKPPRKTQDGQHPEPYEAWQPPGDPNTMHRPPGAVAAEEFAVLNDKLAAGAARSSFAAEPRRGMDLVSEGEIPRKKKTASQVALEEFAALERKIGSGGRAEAGDLTLVSEGEIPTKKKTASQVALEEFAALERKIGSGGRAETGDLTKSLSSSLLRPKVRWLFMCSMQHLVSIRSKCHPFSPMDRLPIISSLPSLSEATERNPSTAVRLQL